MKIEKLKNWKKYYSEKKPHKIIMAHECQIWSKIFYSKRKKTQNYHGPWAPNLILSYQALYTTK